MNYNTYLQVLRTNVQGNGRDLFSMITNLKVNSKGQAHDYYTSVIYYLNKRKFTLSKVVQIDKLIADGSILPTDEADYRFIAFCVDIELNFKLIKPL